jgi:hypothetical protein
LEHPEIFYAHGIPPVLLFSNSSGGKRKMPPPHVISATTAFFLLGRDNTLSGERARHRAWFFKV